eukprot:180067-Hanusia_phi.AAC.1
MIPDAGFNGSLARLHCRHRPYDKQRDGLSDASTVPYRPPESSEHTVTRACPRHRSDGQIVRYAAAPVAFNTG